MVIQVQDLPTRLPTVPHTEALVPHLPGAAADPITPHPELSCDVHTTSKGGSSHREPGGMPRLKTFVPQGHY